MPGGDPTDSVIWHADGSFTLLDDAGAPVGDYSATGTPLSDAGMGAALAREFSALFNYGARAWIDSNLRAQPAAQAASATAAKPQIPSILLLALAAFAVYKFAK